MISGLTWVERKVFNNGSNDSFVSPFPNTRPISIVDHGYKKFAYDQYGIHLGQVDLLTFLGNREQLVTAYFIDCRRDSPTFKERFVEEFYPSEKRSLYIPPGVAHLFVGLEGVFTINNYEILLPRPDLVDSTEWTPENDIINLPKDVTDNNIPSLIANTEPASDKLYQLISDYQRNTMSHSNLVHPEERKVKLKSGEEVKVIFRKFAEEESSQLISHELGIDGLLMRQLKTVSTGETSKITLIPTCSPFYVVSHHSQEYNFDSYGMHKGQEDHLTFLGPDKIIDAVFVDCRKDSPTYHKKLELQLRVASDKELVIPPGVAHAFFGLENVYTFNRPAIYLNPNEQYIPANDTHEWPLKQQDYPTIEPNTIEADYETYACLAQLQFNELSNYEQGYGAPKSIETVDEKGNKVRVLLRTT